MRDFFGGMDPTGISTFNTAYGNRERHGMHRATGVAGGFIGGAAASTALGALGTYGMGRILRKRPIGGYLLQGAKDQMSLFNPSRTIKTLRATPEAMEALTLGNAMNKKGLEHLDRGHFMHNVAAQAEVGTLGSEYVAKAKKFRAKYNEDPDDVGARGIAMIGGLAAGGLGGGLNALSAHVQYNAGLKNQKAVSDQTIKNKK